MCRNWAFVLARASLLLALAAPLTAMADEKAPPAAKGEKDAFVTGRDAVTKVLDTPIKIQVVDTSLEDTIADVAKQLRVRMLFDKRGLDDAGIARDVSVSLDVAGVPAREAFSLLFRDYNLALLIRDNHLLVTTPEVADAMLEVVAYDVTDLVMFQDADGKWYESNPDDFVDTVTTTIQPTSWDKMGGPGSIRACDLPLSTVLVCSQTQMAHRELALLLVDLRKVEATRRGLEKLPAPGPNDMLRRRLHVRNPPRTDDKSEPTQAAVLPPSENRDQLARQTNVFAWDLFQRLKGRSDENLFFSPVGVALSLGFLRAGAQGLTADELAAALHLTDRSGGRANWVLPEPDVTPAYASVFQSMRAERATHGYQLRVATKLWRRSGQSCAPAFLESAKLLGVEVDQHSKMGREEFIRSVNAWMADQTRGSVAAELTDAQAEQANGGILKNVMHFHGEWRNRFAADATQPAPFRAGKRTWTVPMMTARETLDYCEVDGLRVVEKRYCGDAVSLVVLLPSNEADGLEWAEKRLTPIDVERWLNLLRPVEVELCLPRFRISQQHDLKRPLMELGLATAFDPAKADFKGIDAVLPLHIAFVGQDAMVDVSEAGTRAVTSTTAGLAFGGPPKPPGPVIFRADHPFLFLLRDVRTGAILFIGRYAVPTETAKAGA